MQDQTRVEMKGLSVRARADWTLPMFNNMTSSIGQSCRHNLEQGLHGSNALAGHDRDDSQNKRLVVKGSFDTTEAPLTKV